ncbi:zinc ribbon domain-containing protein [Sodalis sp. dw_96]|uniref:zinc ribbon domain-containing protein n=1 Tax=Sodalis sp. dw_96 TaxID=2719794 RepID=UPI001BD3A0B0|nr:zinc ribbon domain-containing protein [Sodalis sp. dw_96]
MDQKCPVCQHELQRQEADFYCPSCQGRFKQEVLCPDCGKPLEVLMACGAVDYFCPHGDGLISKKRVTPRYSAL